MVEPVGACVHELPESSLNSTKYSVICVNPVLVGAVHVKLTCVFPCVPVKSVGIPGRPKVTPGTGELYGPDPTIFTALT